MGTAADGKRRNGLRILWCALVLICCTAVQSRAENLQRQDTGEVRETAFSDAESGSDPGSGQVIEEVVYAEPSGEVVLTPEPAWEDGEHFHISFTLSNESDMDIPETELSLLLPGESGLSFAGAHEIRWETGALSREVPVPSLTQDEMHLRFTDFPQGAVLRFRLSGKRDQDASAEPEEPFLVSAALTLRGNGLRHATDGRFPMPDPPRGEAPVPAPPEEPRYQLIVRLSESGHLPVMRGEPAQAAVHEYDLNIDAEYSGIKLHFMQTADAEETGERAQPLRMLLSLLPGLLIWQIVRKILYQCHLRREERRRKFDPLLKLY